LECIKNVYPKKQRGQNTRGKVGETCPSVHPRIDAHADENVDTSWVEGLSNSQRNFTWGMGLSVVIFADYSQRFAS